MSGETYATDSYREDVRGRRGAEILPFNAAIKKRGLRRACWHSMLNVRCSMFDVRLVPIHFTVSVPCMSAAWPGKEQRYGYSPG